MPNDSTVHSESWKQAIATTQDALAFLQTTAEDVATSRTIDSDVRSQAINKAKHLVAALAEHGFSDAAQHAQNVVATLDHAGLPQPERLHQQVGDLSA